MGKGKFILSQLHLDENIINFTGYVGHVHQHGGHPKGQKYHELPITITWTNKRVGVQDSPICFVDAKNYLEKW